MSVFADKTLLITGGTGSFGHAVLERLLTTDIGQIRVFSRDEKKQDDMRREYQNQHPDRAQKLRFYLGDVRNRVALKSVMRGVDYVFHAAALKQVPSCEFQPIEAVETNVLGTENVLDTALDAGVERVICLSTDKAVYPINAMGMSKALMEKAAVAKSRLTTSTRICCARYGNILCSRGSVVPLWMEQIMKGKPITITDPNMTRFIMTMDEAVDLALLAFQDGCGGDILVRKAPACTIETKARALLSLFHGEERSPLRVIGIRHGEKLYETLLGSEEFAVAEDMGTFYRVPCDKRDMNYERGAGKSAWDPSLTYNSNNVHRLDVEQVKQKLLKVPYVRQHLAAWEERK